jgi:hypothetical protein
MADICPGRCNNAYRRAADAYKTALTAWETAEQRHTADLAEWEDARRRNAATAGPRPRAKHGPDPEPPNIKPWPGDPIWCTRCAAAIGSALAALDELLPLRLAQADGYGAPGDYTAGRVIHTTADPPSPSPGHDDLDEVLDWLRTWEAHYRKLRGWPPPPRRGMTADALTSTLAWLGARLSGLLAHPDVADTFGAGVQWWHHRLQNATHTRPPLSKKPAPCRRCGRHSLFFHDDALRPTIRCHADADTCGLIMTTGEYDEYQARYEDDRKREAKAS